MQLYGKVESFKQWQAAHVADENRATGLHHFNCAFDHAQQVIDAREVLDNRIENDEIKGVLARCRQNCLRVFDSSSSCGRSSLRRLRVCWM